MNLPYFYESLIVKPHNTLSEETSKHCIQVLRMKEGEQLQLTDGKGNLYTATITNADKQNCEVSIESQTSNQQAATGNISIAISLLKNPMRFEWFVEKVSEIGVREIYPLICDHTVKENFRYERMNSILISAMLQSRQTWLTKLHHPKKFNAFVTEEFDVLKLIAHCKEDEKLSINRLDLKNKNSVILIGPEGDFSQSEVDVALTQNFIPVSLGNTRLRSETAGIVAAALLRNIHQQNYILS